MIMKLGSIVKLASAALAIASYALVARADTVPAGFVPIESCATKPCTCLDLPTLKLMLADQTRARDAWKTVKAEIIAGTGPTTTDDARARFNTLFGAASPGILTQYQSCPGYDPLKNDPKKIAGVSSAGVPVFDSCFCSAFCSDIIQATLAHEKMHVTSGAILTAGSLHMLAFCKVINHPECVKLAPLTLAASEIASHEAGMAKLKEAIDRLEPQPDCTTTPMKDAGSTDAVAPTGLAPRIHQLADRVLYGRAQ